MPSKAPSSKAKKSRSGTPKDNQAELLAPKTSEGVNVLSYVTSKYELPVPPPLSDTHKDTQFPDDLSAVHGEDLSNLMGYYTALMNYASYQATLLATDIAVFSARESSMVEEQLHRMTGGTITEKKAQARMHPSVREVRKKLEVQQGVYDLIKALFGNYERCFQALSREVTRRHSSVEV